jgi:ABC-2 type transport system ATP-binding protein
MDNLFKRLEKESWIKKLKKHDSFLTLDVEKGDEKIPLIIEIAQKLSIKIKSINVRKPTLDDVFLSYTGRTIRENDGRVNPKDLIHPRFHRG